MGHVNEKILRATAAHYNLKLNGVLNNCIACSLAKIHHAPISRDLHDRSTIPGERIYIDVSYFNHSSIAGNKYWLLIVDDATDMTWSFFMKNKSDLPERLVNFIYNMKERGTPVQKIRLDNAGENYALQQQCNKLFLQIQFEFTSPNTPKQNSRVERKFTVLYDYIRTMTTAAKVPLDLKYTLWAEAAAHATDVINGLCSPTNTKPPYRAFYGIDPPYFPYLKPFGMVAIIASNKKLKSKLANRGYMGLYLGRVRDHTVDTYRFYNMATRSVLLSRSVKFTNLMYSEYIPQTIPVNPYSVLYTDDDDDDEPPFAPTATPSTTTPLVSNPSFDSADPNVQVSSLSDTDLFADDLPSLEPVDTEPVDTPFHTPLQTPDSDPFDNMDDLDFGLLPPPAPQPSRRQSTRLERELRKLDGHLNHFKHQPPWSLGNSQ